MAVYEESLSSISLDSDSSLAFYTGVPGMPGSADPNWGRQYRFVRLTGAHQVGLCTAAGQKAVGVLQNKPQRVGEAATVAVGGVSMVHSGAAIAVGDYIVPDAAGRGVTAGGSDKPNGMAFGSTTGADQLFPMLILGH